MKTYFLFDRTVKLGKVTFTKGVPVKAQAVRKASPVNGLSVHGHLITDDEALITLNNLDMRAHKTKASLLEIAEDDTAIEANFQLCLDHLVSLGFAREDIVFHRNEVQSFNGTGQRPGWVGVPMVDMNDRFLRDTGRPVTLKANNWITVGTFISRVERGMPLFTHESF